MRTTHTPKDRGHINVDGIPIVNDLLVGEDLVGAGPELDIVGDIFAGPQRLMVGLGHLAIERTVGPGKGALIPSRIGPVYVNAESGIVQTFRVAAPRTGVDVEPEQVDPQFGLLDLVGLAGIGRGIDLDIETAVV